MLGPICREHHGAWSKIYKIAIATLIRARQSTVSACTPRSGVTIAGYGWEAMVIRGSPI
jgi:hypothetical protein